MSKTTPSPTPPHRWLRKRFLIPAVLVGLLLLLLTVAIVRGSWADKVPKDPTGLEEGVICRLYQPPEGPWQVRCAMVLDASPERVWKVVTDYDHFEDIFPTLKSASAEHEAGGNVRLKGEANSTLGTWPYDILIEHEVKGDRRVAHWDGSSGKVQSIRGGWTVTPAGEGRTLLVYASHVEIKGFPDWFVVNALLLRQPKVMQAVADQLHNTE